MTTELVSDISVQPGEHLVQFYDREPELVQSVGRYVIDGARAGDVAVLIATEAHRSAFVAELEQAGIDLAQASRDGEIVMLDAAATMSSFTRGGRIDGEGFMRVIGGVLRDAARTGRGIRAYGEMVAPLWDAGNVLAAIELEKLWNELGRELPFTLLCVYHSESVSGHEHVDALERVCHLHSAIMPPATSEARESDQASAAVAHFEVAPGAPGAARRFVSEALKRWGHNGALVRDAQLVVSELATNAVVHARSAFSIVVSHERSALRISVRDGSPVKPRLRQPEPLAASGRGLQLVAALADEWGTQVESDGKTIWAVFPA